MVADGRPADAGGARRADARRHRAVPCREPAGGRAHRSRPVPFRQSPGVLSRSRRGGSDRDVFPVAARDPQAGLAGLRRQRRPGRGHAVFRRRDQRRPALAGDPRRQHSAVGISQTGFRDPDRLAVRRIRQAARHAGQHGSAGVARHGRELAGAAAGFRPDHADHAGVGRAVLYGGHALHLGARLRRHRQRRPAGRRFTPSRMSRSASIASSIPPPATPSTSISPPNRLSVAAGSAAARARARSNASCPRAIPISSSPWPARNSASCSASFWWLCSLSL